MSGLLPTGTNASSEQNGDPRTLWLDSDDTGDLLASLSSDTARAILTALHEEPQTASEVATRVDTSVQNARHHLSKLKQVDAVRVADTRYSEKGREMSVYAPSEEPLVVFVGREERKHSFLDSLRGLMSVIGLLGIVSLLVQWIVTPTIDRTTGEQLPRAGDALGNSGAVGLSPLGVPPGVIFFAGGVLVLLFVIVVQHREALRELITG
ncbi:ArsR/SmtB family transcription factor [Halocatena pleomorpha]|uniref:ArsR family transcriptional regulator n=1 Tax=Halocatena pleomorpha TaxID=1785090 RepID=A0A3P3RL55_9EURY|nr:helix-turn-helix domain-containing protein [Halocatena pleomorpha]RRJ33123.1 ArsR family transcriptional regulator [Halocatena pleomorpha]